LEISDRTVIIIDLIYFALYMSFFIYKPKFKYLLVAMLCLILAIFVFFINIKGISVDIFMKNLFF
jgi:hypothetical protein